MTRRFRTVLIFAAGLLGVVMGFTSWAEADVPLAPNLAAIVDGNQAALDSLKSFRGSVKTIGEYQLVPDMELLRVTKIENLWFDAQRFRKDLVVNGVTDGGSLPAAPNGLRPGHASADYSLAPPGRIEIGTPQARLLYFPESTMLRRGTPRAAGDEYDWNVVLKYQSVSGHTLRDKVVKVTQLGYHFTTTPVRVEGDDAILLSCRFEDVDMTLNIWVIPAKGYLIQKVQNIFRGQIVDEYVANLVQYPSGLWWFDVVRVSYWKQGEKIPYHLEELSLQNVAFNVTQEPATFTVKGASIPDGITVIDAVQ
jgi:hypothetical protein